MLERGEVVGEDFEILEPLGRGGMGMVFLARQRSTDAERALKIMLPEWLRNPSFLRRFELEARASARIRSEHVVEVIAHGVDPTRRLPWLAMEYLRGQTLEERLAELGAPGKDVTVELVRQLFHAVSAAHDADLVHRDLKPQNLFVADSRRADVPFTLKVLDFGIAKLVSSALSSTQPLGTQAWMAPEQENTGMDIAPSADVWALGLIVFWLLTGRCFWLHAGSSQSLLSFEQNFADMPRASARALEYGVRGWSPALDTWFARAVSRDPGARYPNAALAYHELLPVLQALPEWGGSSSWSKAPDTGVFGARIRARAEPRALEASGERYSTRLYNVPQPSQSFVGRSRELSALRAQLLGQEARLSVSVEGLPGIGKTELVLQLAHQLALEGHFPGGIFWFAAESKDLLVAWASEAVAGALDASGGSIQERAQSAVNAVSRSGLRSLVILDNVESWSEAERPTPLPIGVHVTLLVTTRARRLGGSRFRALPLAFLSDEEAQLLLTTVAGADVDSRPGFDALLEHLRGYTLAVELAATYLSEYPETSPAEYLALLGAGKEPEADAAHFTRYEHTVNDAFALLWARLDTRVRALWELAARFAPEPVSGALSDAVGLDAEGRRELRRYHLIEMDSEGSWRMHRLTRAFAHAAGDESSRARATEAFVSGVVARAAPMELATAFRTYAPDRAHFDAAVGLARADAKAIRSCELFASIACAMHSVGELEPARELLELAVAGDLQNFGEEHENVATLRSNLANLLQDLGELSTALTLLEKALASDLAHRADNHFKILLRRNNLALLHQHMGNPEKGREVLAPALEASLPVLGEDHQMVAIARSNLGAILTDLGEFDAAEGMLRSSLDSDLRRHGEDHPYPAIRRFRLANLCEARGDLPGAIALLEVVIRSEQAVRGPSHPRLALARAALAAVFYKAGNHARAELEAELALRGVRNQPPRSYFRTRVEKLASGIR